MDAPCGELFVAADGLCVNHFLTRQMYFPDRSGRGGQLNGADSGLEKILAEFQSVPSCNYDEQIPLPDTFMSSPGYGAGTQASFGQDLLTSSLSLPSDGRFQQELLAASRSAPPLVAIPQASNGMVDFRLLQQQQHQQPTDVLLQQDNISMLLPQRSRGSSEDDYGPAVNEPAGPVKRQKRLAEKNRTAQKRYRERQKEKMHDFEKQVEQLSEQVTMLMREKASLETRNSLLERVVQLKDEQQQHTEYGQEGARSPEELALCRALADFHNLVRIRDPPIRAEDISSSDHTFVLQLYNAYANELMQCMLSAFADDPSSEGFQRMEQLVRGHQNAVLQLTRQDPKQMTKLTKELKKRQPPSGQELWRKCVDVMKLDKEQKRRLVGLRNDLFERMESIIEHRRRIISHLEASMPTRDSVCAGPAHHQAFSTALQASDELKESLELEHKEVSQFVSAFHASDILTPLQAARATIEAYPYMQDVFGIVETIAAEEGEQSQGSFMASLMGQRNNGSLMPADSAFRMVSSVPPPLRTASTSHDTLNSQEQGASATVYDHSRKFSSASS
ncbi:hypothetical protein WJX75_006442 [Coccomyxa subellipsoidea]|uniref:BZIP domain-containing protein n=1 Tax=Coccomyxa subellipsoidea TaxID=248742 RepID=A0ABR2YGS2_9CHLO